MEPDALMECEECGQGLFIGVLDLMRIMAEPRIYTPCPTCGSMMLVKDLFMGEVILEEEF